MALLRCDAAQQLDGKPNASAGLDTASAYLCARSACSALPGTAKVVLRQGSQSSHAVHETLRDP